MKKIAFTLVAIFVALLVNAQVGKDLDNENGTSMLPIISELESTVRTIEKEKVEIVRMEFDLIFQDRPKQTVRTLSQGYTYGIIVWGDYRIKQIAVNVYKNVDGNWQFVATGELKDRATTAFVKIEEAAEYKFEYHAIEFEEGFKAGHYAMILLHDVP